MNIIPITDLSSQLFNAFTIASESELCNSEGAFIAESEYIISLAVRNGFVPRYALCETALTSKLCAILPDSTPVYCADKSVLISITGYNLTEGMLCLFERKKSITIKEAVRDAKRIAVLEHVMNPTNVGAIMRSAAALGIDAVLLTYDCADPLYRRASRVGRGSAFLMPYAYFPKQEHYLCIQSLTKLGFKTVAMALSDDSISIDDSRLTACDKLAIVVGSEGEGLTQKTIDCCDFTAKIPMQRGMDSLNVAAATSIIFWQLKK